MHPSRSLTVALVLALLAVLSWTTGGTYASAQSVDDAESNAADAQQDAQAADGLVDAAVAHRTEIEAQLAAGISRINDLAAELSTVSSTLDRLQQQIVFANAEISGLRTDLESNAVDAYMAALAAPGTAVVNAESVEKAMVAGLVIGDVVTAGRAEMKRLSIKQGALQDLQSNYLADQEQVSALKAAVDAEVEQLADLYEKADSQVAEAVRNATAADAAYRAALGEVETAKAREAERRREEQRETTTTTTTTTSPPVTTTTAPGASTTTVAGTGREWHFPPAVEQWRDEVIRFFPSSRVDEALAVLQCESLGDPNAYNPYSGASGLFQFLPSTWASTAPRAGYPDAGPFEPVANIATAAWLTNRYQDLGLDPWQAWNCRRVLG